MTVFRVVPDQLRVSDGWVRCGQCDEVFDASAHMQALAETSEPSESVAEPAAPKPSVAWSPIAPIEAIHRADETHRIEPTLDGVRALDAPLASLHTQRSSDETFVDGTLTPALALSEAAPQTDLLVAEPPPSFMRGRSGASLPRRPWVSASLYLSALLLSAGLIFQVLLHERDRIAAHAPEMKPVVEAICEWMQCTVLPLRQIESVVLDSSSFNKLRDAVYRLNFILKNTSQMALALPAIEISLTDVQDQVLLRRVIYPDVLGFKSDHLAPASESSASLILSVHKQEGASRIVGYRILAFYP